MYRFLSIIIPVYNSEKGLKDTLDSLSHQQKSTFENVEIIVIDNNSTDNTVSIANEYLHASSLPVKVFTEKKQGSYAARNLGIEKASGDLICFLDADVVVENKFLSKISTFFNSRDIDYAGVNVLMERSSSTMASDYDALKSFHIDNTISNGHFTPTICLVVKQEVIKKVGLFDCRFESGGDVVFGKMCFEAGYSQMYLGEIVVKHPTRDSYQALIKKARRVGRGYAQQMFFYPKMFDHSNKYFKKITFYLPSNPLRLFRVSRERDLNFSFLYCLLLSFLGVPIAITHFVHYRLEFKRLSSMEAK